MAETIGGRSDRTPFDAPPAVIERGRRCQTVHSHCEAAGGVSIAIANRVSPGSPYGGLPVRL